MLGRALTSMTREMARVARLTAGMPAIQSGIEPGATEWLDVAHAAGALARTAKGDHAVVLRATQRLAMASYLLSLYDTRQSALERIAAAALDEWEFAGFAARRLGVNPADVLTPLTDAMLRPQ